MRGWLAAALAALGLWIAPRPAGATGIDLAVEHCSLDYVELSRLVTLELSSVLGSSDGPSQYGVLIRCTPTQIFLRLRDPLTKKYVERSFIAPTPDQPEPERIVALTVAQLYRASWLELVADDEPPLSNPEPEPPRAAVDVARDAAQKTLPRNPLPDRDWSLSLGVGVHVRHLSAPIALPHLDVQGGWAPSDGLRLLLSGGFEAGNVVRQTGSVDASILRAGAGIGIDAVSFAGWVGFAELEAGVAMVRLQGTSVSAGYESDSISSPGLEGSTALGVAWNHPSLRFELATTGGFLMGTPEGLVQDDAPVSLNGIWLGGEVRLSWMP